MMIPELPCQLLLLLPCLLHGLQKVVLDPWPPSVQNLLTGKADNVVPESDISKAVHKSQVGREAVKDVLIQEQGSQLAVVFDAKWD